MPSSAPLRPAVYAEDRIISGILEGLYPIEATLPAERELAVQLGVTRPTLREALQRLARDGWLEIRQGKPTRVRDYWHEGSLGVLTAIARRSSSLPVDFIPNLLSIRLALAPAYASQAVARQSQQVVQFLAPYPELPDSPEVFASEDWLLHHKLSVLSGNPIYTLILNGFCDLYVPMAIRYFQTVDPRQRSRSFYFRLLESARQADPESAEEITRQAMADSITIWEEQA